MAVKEIKKGSILFRSGQKLDQLCIITKGTVKALYNGGELLLNKGDCIGLADIYYGTHSFNTITLEDTTLLCFPYQKLSDLKGILSSGKDFNEILINSITYQVCNLLDHFIMYQFECNNTFSFLQTCNGDYKELCIRYNAAFKGLPGYDEITPLILDEDIDSWVSDFYDTVKKTTTNEKIHYFFSAPEITIGYIMNASLQIHTVVENCQIMADYNAELGSFFLNENQMDFFDLYTSLLYRASKTKEDTLSLSASISKLMIQIESIPSISKTLYQTRVNEYRSKLATLESLKDTPSPVSIEETVNHSQLADSLTTILHYSDCTEEIAASFKKYIQQYKKMQDKNSQEDSARLLRKNIAGLFYELYKEIFLISLSDTAVPSVIKMFLLFGYVDEELAGIENATYLCNLAEKVKGNESLGVYTMYEWLKQIYDGKKEPCRNEFDTDYTGFVHELKSTGKINDEIEGRMLADRAQKVIFEIQNVFPLVNKITFGHASSFCPVFSEHNILRSLEDTLVQPAAIQKAENIIRQIDYSAFYRETVFASPALGTIKEFIHVEVLPDVILTPMIGTRGIMWQEIEGKRRTTAARMMLPLFNLEDTTTTFVRLTGEYRWEMCKRVQGARWNDYSELSLTSEYFDYIQFFKRNHDLSPETRDKIKLSLQKAKNNFREMFVRDYVTWIMLEASGSPRLNKVSRKILFSYCPFSKALRTQLSNNPAYKELFDRYDILTKQKLHRLDNLFSKISSSGNKVPEELIRQREFLEK